MCVCGADISGLTKLATMLFGLVQIADKSVLFLKSHSQVIRSDLWCLHTALYLHGFLTQKYDNWKNVDTSSCYPNTWVFKSRCGTPLHRTDSMEQTDEFDNDPCCSHGRPHCAARGLRRTQSSDWWEYVVLGTFDKTLRANFTMCHRMFVRVCGHQAPYLVPQDPPFRHPVSVK